MGYAYTDLILPAVLYSNPGLNKYELVNLLKEIHFSNFREYSKEEPWDFYENDFEKKIFDGGLETLASDFRLPKTQKFVEFQKNKIDKNGLNIGAPFLIGFDYTKQKFDVLIHKKNILGKEKEIYNEFFYEKLSEGDIFSEGIIKNILREEKFGNLEDDTEIDFSEGPNYEYDLRIIPIKSIHKRKTFSSEKKLYKKYPLFNPIEKYDWSVTKGEIYTGGIFSEKMYFWEQRNGKYYLDNKTFDILCEGFSTGFSFGYTDLIMTSEAIKNKSWKLLSYKGSKFIDLFLKDFPSSNSIYKNAVYDAHTSVFAKKKEMTNFELMRFRLINKFKG